jgi:hypothetical protein
LYGEYPDDSDRHDVLSGVAQLIFQKVIAGGVDPRALAAALGKALDGNHLAIYSTNPSLEALITRWASAGTSRPPPATTCWWWARTRTRTRWTTTPSVRSAVGGRYQLTLQNQAMANPDHFLVRIALPAHDPLPMLRLSRRPQSLTTPPGKSRAELVATTGFLGYPTC